MITIPFSFLPPKLLFNQSKHFLGVGQKLHKIFPFMQLELEKADLDLNVERYLAMCVTATTFLFVSLTLILLLFLSKLGLYPLALLLAVILSSFAFIMQVNYPKVLAQRRVRKMDTDLLAALSALMVQLDAGVPLFRALVAVSKQNFGEISKELKKTVKQINAGVPELDALESMALRNPSPYLRRALWQIINGVKEGATINKVINNVFSNLNKEQIVQIEKYGSDLNPLATFYMMGAVIIPALAITLLVVAISFIGLGELLIKTIFWSFLVAVIFFQIIFSGIIKTKRPSLLGE